VAVFKSNASGSKAIDTWGFIRFATIRRNAFKTEIIGHDQYHIWPSGCSCRRYFGMTKKCGKCGSD
jgi:hypothetical protein